MLLHPDAENCSKQERYSIRDDTYLKQQNMLEAFQSQWKLKRELTPVLLRGWIQEQEPADFQNLKWMQWEIEGRKRRVPNWVGMGHSLD